MRSERVRNRRRMSVGVVGHRRAPNAPRSRCAGATQVRRTTRRDPSSRVPHDGESAQRPALRLSPEKGIDAGRSVRCLKPAANCRRALRRGRVAPRRPKVEGQVNMTPVISLLFRKGPTSPLHALQIRTHDVPEMPRLFMRNVVGEMGAIPYDHIGAVDRLTVDPMVDSGLIRWADGVDTVIDL